jgi:UDP-N-acetylmuramyl pentapeptide phosphotransferase/UDP-N-acetylglucosamine-1-phosphate transferase
MIISYILIAIILLILELLYFKIADKYDIIDKPNLRSSHKTITLRGGGVIFYFGVLVYLLFSKLEYPWFFCGLTLITIVSFVDDIKSLTPKLRLLLHFVSMLLMFHQWQMINIESWWMIIIALIVCTGIINVYNFMDGINGITGGYSLVVLSFLAYVDIYKCQFVDIDFIAIVVIALIIFCFYNFRKRAKCFAGDVGSVSIAFIILFLLGRLILKTHDFSWIIFLVVYGVDGVLTILHRIMLHENVTKPHRKHAFQIMANELKIPHVVVSLIYMLLQSVVCVAYMIYPGYMMLLISIIILSFAYIIFMKKYFYLHNMNNG